MNKFFELGLILIAAVAVAVADVLTKKAAFNVSHYTEALKSPLLPAIIILYVLQIGIFLYIFVRKAELGIVGVIQTAVFAIIVIGSGVLFFGERISMLQGIGMALALTGVALINL